MKWMLGIVTVLIMAAAVALFVIPAKAPTTAKAGISDLIVVDAPLPGATIDGRTVTITGQARGTWYFEASFPIKITRDSDTAVLAQGPAQAQGEWMTEDFVPFVATLEIGDEPQRPLNATIILKNDNPSGDPSLEKVLEIPVVFR